MPTIVEAICRFIKQIMRCIKHLFGQFVEQYFDIMIQNYSVSSADPEKTGFDVPVLSRVRADDLLH